MAGTDESKPRSWTWGPFSVSLWSVIVYVLLILAFALSRLRDSAFHIPLYDKAEFIQGSYPMFWLVYICLPFIMRDVWVTRKSREPFSLDLRVAMVVALLVTILSYRYVFGWY